MSDVLPFLGVVNGHLSGIPIRSIFEIGAHDCEDSVKLADSWPSATVCSFEPNPATLPLCEERSLAHDRIRLFKTAVSDSCGEVDFYQSATENQGFSSLFEPSGNYDSVEEMPYNKITVPCTRLDVAIEEHSLTPPDIMWLDAQGSELNAIRSLGKYLPSLKAVWTEYTVDEMYKGAPLMPEFKSFMGSCGFRLAFVMAGQPYIFNGKGWWGDCAFVRISL